jgi:hypothetical protein
MGLPVPHLVQHPVGPVDRRAVGSGFEEAFDLDALVDTPGEDGETAVVGGVGVFRFVAGGTAVGEGLHGLLVPSRSTRSR